MKIKFAFKTTASLFLSGACLLAARVHAATGANPSPADWIDPDTGHRVIRISPEPGSVSLYFHQNFFTPDGDRMIFDSPSGIAVVDLKSLGQGTPKVGIVVSNASALAMSRKAPEVYFQRRDGMFCAANLDTHAVREIIRARVTAINCDETFIVNTINAEDPSGKTPRPAPRVILPQAERMFPGRTNLTTAERTAATKEDGLSRRLANQACMAFVFTDVKTGRSVTNGYQYAWLNHLQFSPTDPNLLLYCHEGTWHEVDRVWTIRTDGSEQRLMHQRTMDMEIAGHEFWSHDGELIWFDLQTPRSQDFWLANVDVKTGKETRYHLARDWWGVHYSVSWDGKLFSSDGGDPAQVAYAQDGMWMNLFRPQPDGTVVAERLVNMATQNYRGNNGEPNGNITPDGKWLVFRSNMQGPLNVYAVEIARSQVKLGGGVPH
jgi:oligogalacturonide lyase